MGRINVIHNHPMRSRIDAMISDGIPQVEIARRMSLAPSTLSRYISATKSELAKIVDEEPGVVDVLSRLVEVADHARTIRQHSKLSASPVSQARAVKTEAEILTKLLSELGIQQTTVTNTLDESRALVTAFKIFLRTYPESSRDLITVLDEIPELTDLARALRRAGTGAPA